MPISLRQIIPLFVTLGFASLLTGCPPATTLTASPATLNFTLENASRDITVDFTNGARDWTASDNQPWLTISRASGNGDGSVTVTVDRAQMDTTQANSGTVTITAGTLTDTVNVTVEDMPSEDPSEYPSSDIVVDLPTCASCFK